MRTLKLRYSGLVIGLLLILSPSAFCENNMTLTLQYDAFTDDDSPENTGTQMAVPFQWMYARGPFAVTLQTAYAHTAVSRNDSEDFTQSGITDTFVSGSYTYPFATQNPTRVIMDLAVRLPTGEENLDDEYAIIERILRRDRFRRGDLFRIDILGEGLNVGGTLGLERESGGSTFGLYGGYIYYGQYDLRWDETVNEYNPGDEIFARVLYRWENAPRYTLQAYLGYSYFGVDTVNDADTLRIGDKLAAGADLQAGLLENLDMTLSLQYIAQFKSEEALDGNLVEETDNSNGDELFALLDLTYHYNPRFSIPLVGELRYYDESDRKREDLDLPYEGRRVRYAIGAGFKYRITPSIAFRGLGSYFYLDCDPDASLTDHRVFQGMNLDIGMMYTF